MAFKNLILTYTGKRKIGKRIINTFVNEDGKAFTAPASQGNFRKGTTYQLRSEIEKQKSGIFKIKKSITIGTINNRSSITKRILEKDRMLDVSEIAGANYKKFANKVRRQMEQRVISVYKSSPAIQFALGKNIIDKGTEKMTLAFNSTFDDYVRATQHSVGFNYALPFTDSELAALAARKSPIINDMIIKSARLKVDLKQKLLQNMGSGLPKHKIVKALKDSYPAYSQHIGTLTNTGLKNLYKDGTYSKTKQHFNKHKYAGPADLANRTYCAEHVGKIYKGSEADEQQSAIMDFYNCRHQMEPII